MKEFKFWANTIPLKYYYPIAILFFLLLFYLTFLAQDYFKANFLYIMIFVFVYIILSLVISVKRVKVLITEENRISIFMNGEEKYESSVDELKYIKGVDVAKINVQAPLIMQFSEKKFTFNIFEVKGIPRLNNQIKLLRYMVDRFSFEKGGRKGNISYTSYTYSNPNYKGY
ncbi:hypothetical protein [Dysgonomonas sp. Marseille-P4361]|uniref:hypothetical protein n=1 Tax=Dysgonomonas sp. Marseille-P4361 TaxID=2161820 RepID=UPI000D54E5BF|nr:hypothetical protein [Dysgonomonas sp. Marseille-P4361]